MSAEAQLTALGIEVPAPAAPLANYVPFVQAGTLLFVSGQLPMRAGSIAWRGKVGEAVSPADGSAAARQCLLNVLGQVRVALGTLDRVRQVVRLGGFVAAAPGFFDLALVMNGASDLAVEVFGAAGRHARSTVGVAVLPGDAAVEVEGVFEVE